MKPKICFVLLRYQKETHRHYFHIYEFLEALAKESTLRILVVSADAQPRFENAESVIDLSGGGRIKLYQSIIKAWRDGFRIFYNHYTTAAARFASVVTRLMGGRTYLWHCIVMEDLDRLGKLAIVHRFILKMTLFLIHNLVTGLPNMGDYYSKHYGIPLQKIKIIPNYLNMERFDPEKKDPRAIRSRFSIPDDKKIILYLHELEEGRAKHLVRIVHAILDSRNDVVFLIAGNGRFRPKLEYEFQEHVQRGFVIFAGAIPNIDAPDFYRAADLFIMTSDFEAFSRVLLEAMAMGVAYVATDGGGNIREYTPSEHQEFIISTSRIEQFTEKMNAILNDKALRNTLIAAGRKHVRSFSIQSVLKRFLSEITE